jgi:hypothetical protein
MLYEIEESSYDDIEEQLETILIKEEALAKIFQ